MLFPYFARREKEGGFRSPTKHWASEPPGQEQVSISFLLDLDWSISKDFEEVREKENSLKIIRKEAKTGVLGEIVGSAADLRTRLAVLEQRCARLRQNIADFNVLPQYRDLETEASEITRHINLLSNENAIDRQRLAQIQESLTSENQPSIMQLSQLYEEANIIFPELVKRRFEEVEAFHKSVLSNRESYLRGEMDEAESRITTRESDMSELEKRRVEIMTLLKSHGALDQYQKFQTELSRCEADLESTQKQFEAAQLLEQKQDELQDDRRRLKRRLRQDFDERKDILKRTILYFEEVSSSLYGQDSGSLVFEETENGPKFQVKIHGQDSKGITNMQIFCFDMMLMQICSERGIGPGFLIHDSHLFDGVDERQIANALQYGASAADRFGFQYIVTMNEDVVPCNLFSKTFSFGDYVLPTVLTDDENGGLFGIRF